MTDKPRRQRKKREESSVSFEDALARLEEIAEQLEGGELSLEKAIALAEEGLKLSQLCEKQLTEAEGKIEQLVERMGAVGVEPMEMEDGFDYRGRIEEPMKFFCDDNRADQAADCLVFARAVVLGDACILGDHLIDDRLERR